MPTELLSAGIAWTMKAGQVYALPPYPVTIYTDAASPTLTQSTTQAFTASSPVTLTGGSADLVGLFIKAAADTLVILKRK